MQPGVLKTYLLAAFSSLLQVATVKTTNWRTKDVENDAIVLLPRVVLVAPTLQ